MTPEQKEDRIVAALAAAGIMGWIAVLILFIAALIMAL